MGGGARGPDARAVRLVVDVGSGPGVGTCELARRFPDAQVIAVDSSPAMLARVERRAAAGGLGGRISTHLAELPGGLDGIGTADVIWASMSLHHVGDEAPRLRALHGLLDQGGLLAIAERAEPTRVFPTIPAWAVRGWPTGSTAGARSGSPACAPDFPTSRPPSTWARWSAVAGFEVVARGLPRAARSSSVWRSPQIRPPAAAAGASPPLRVPRPGRSRCPRRLDRPSRSPQRPAPLRRIRRVVAPDPCCSADRARLNPRRSSAGG